MVPDKTGKGQATGRGALPAGNL